MEDTGWREKINQFKIPIGLSLIGTVLIIGGVFASGLNKEPKVFPKGSLVESQKTISVDVSGAVKIPGVYQLNSGARIGQAVSAAGGFRGDANQEYISKYLNMAQKLSDGNKVYVPQVGEGGINQSEVVAGTNIHKININTASQSELESLSGIGPVTASKIISGRQYQTIESLLDKKIVSKAVFEKIKDSLVVY